MGEEKSDISGWIEPYNPFGGVFMGQKKKDQQEDQKPTKTGDPSIPFYEDKVWGRVQHIFASPEAAVSLLEVKAGFRCSVHRHRWRINLFAVQEGKVRICWYEGEGTTTLRTLFLGPGDIYEMPVCIYHWFEVVESGRMVEVYWRSSFIHSVEHDDIERLDVGGPIG